MITRHDYPKFLGGTIQNHLELVEENLNQLINEFYDFKELTEAMIQSLSTHLPESEYTEFHKTYPNL